jgi:hypothetical protein
VEDASNSCRVLKAIFIYALSHHEASVRIYFFLVAKYTAIAMIKATLTSMPTTIYSTLFLHSIENVYAKGSGATDELHTPMN